MKSLGGDLFVGLHKTMLGESHLRREPAEDLGVRQRLAERIDRGVVREHIKVPIGAMHVDVLELRRRRQHIVGVIRSIREELLEHDGEQVLARESRRDLRGLRRHCDRIAVVDDQRVDRRIGFMQRGTDRAHVDRPRRPTGEQVRPLQRGHVLVEHTAGRQQHATGGTAPVAGQGGQARHRAHRIAATMHALHAVVQADRRGAQMPVVVRQRLDLGGCDAADRGDLFRRILLRALRQRLEAERMTRDVIVVEPILAHQHMHEPERERGIGAGQQRDVLVALLGGRRAVRVDRDQLRPLALGLLRKAPQVQVRRDRVRAPEDDEPAVRERLHRGAGARAQRVVHRLGTRRRADCAIQMACAQPVEETCGHRFALHQTHRPRIAVRNDALRVDRGDRFQACCDRVERLVPGDALECAVTLGPDALQRVKHAVRVVGALEVAADLRAQRTAGGRMRRIAGDLDRDALFPTLLDGHQHRAGVRAVVRAGGLDRRGLHAGGQPSHRAMTALAY